MTSFSALAFRVDGSIHSENSEKRGSGHITAFANCLNHSAPVSHPMQGEIVANTTIAFGVALILLGFGGYGLTGAQSLTALIPAVAGILFVALGFLSHSPKMRMHAMHGAALFGLLGFVGSVSGISGAIKMAMGQTIARPAAAVSRSIMAMLCLVYVVLAVRSFVRARLLRKQNPPESKVL